MLRSVCVCSLAGKSQETSEIVNSGSKVNFWGPNFLLQSVMAGVLWVAIVTVTIPDRSISSCKFYFKGECMYWGKEGG